VDVKGCGKSQRTARCRKWPLGVVGGRGGCLSSQAVVGAFVFLVASVAFIVVPIEVLS
jgi:hypothetical protein